MLRNILIGSIITLIALIVINRYVFSFTGVLLSAINLCKYKSIGVGVANGHNKKLSYRIDFVLFASSLRPNGNYELIQNENYRLQISRRFNGVKYNMVFENPVNSASEFNLSTYNSLGYPGGSIVGGERCTMPGYWIERNVYLMIKDLPLSDSQKAELRENVVVAPEGNLRITF
jgi:hypothetical protein